MSEIGDDWKAYKAQQKENRRVVRAALVAELVKTGLTFNERNGGSHLLVHVEGRQHIDFWPSSGKWWDALHKKRGYGVPALVVYARNQEKQHAV